MIHQKILWDNHLQISQDLQNNQFNKILDLEKEKAKKGPENPARLTAQKWLGFYLLPKNT